ncbi:MAG: PDZ domain-containing protein [Fuerstiella sp.]
MKRFSKSLLVVAAICLVAGNNSSFAQFKFNKSGGSKSSRSSVSKIQGSSNSSRNSFSRSQSSSNSSRKISSGTINRFRKSPATNNSNSINKGLGRYTIGNGKSPSIRRNTGIGSSNLSGKFGKQPFQSKVGSNKSLRIGGNGLSKVLPQKGSQRLNGGTSKKISNPFGSKFNNAKFKTLPFTSNGINKGLPKSTVSKNGQKWWHDAVHHIIKHNQHHWCHTRPTSCHWWTQYCQPIAHSHHSQVITCDWNRVHCSTVLYVGAPPQNVQWYLGLKGILLPGKGLGIDAVEPNSPAEQVGLQPGMVITVCNGIQLVDEASMQEAIRISGGILQMTLLSADGSQVLEGTVRMSRVAAVSF